MQTSDTTPAADDSSLLESVITPDIVDELLDLDIVEVIQDSIRTLDAENTAMVSHREGSEYLWKFKYGSVEVFVRLTGKTDDDTFCAWSEVLKLPVANTEGLATKLLALNWNDTLEAKFATVDSRVVVTAHRTVAELSPGEIARAITLVANLADNYDDVLQAEFPAAA
jgi:hypothetical protein